jgi:hypothetical protein
VFHRRDIAEIRPFHAERRIFVLHAAAKSLNHF